MAILILSSGCQSDTVKPGREKQISKAGKSRSLELPSTRCGEELSSSITDAKGEIEGFVEIQNDAEHLWLVFKGAEDVKLLKIELYVGPVKNLPKDDSGFLRPELFPYQIANDQGSRTASHKIPLKELGVCYTIAAHVVISENNSKDAKTGWVQGVKSGGGYILQYCTATCRTEPKPCENGPIAEQFNTITQKGWGHTGSDSLYSYLTNRFHAAFPKGLVLGCKRKLILHSGEAIHEWLPSAGEAGKLDKDHEDLETNPLDNSLAGEICALALNVRFDQIDAAFNASPAFFSTLEIAQGAFSGWTIEDVLAEANAVLGGCASNYSPAQMKDVLFAINQNFNNPQADQGFLKCPEL